MHETKQCADCVYVKVAKRLVEDFEYNAAQRRGSPKRMTTKSVFQCHRYPKPLEVPQDHWCGEFRN